MFDREERRNQVNEFPGTLANKEMVGVRVYKEKEEAENMGYS